MDPSAKHSLLIVDDEPEILYSLQHLLRRRFNLHCAPSAKEALRILEANPVHVLMTDQRMPEMSGAELVAIVKQRWPAIVCIMFTGYSDIQAIVQAINQGGLYRYVSKPWDPDALIQLLDEAASVYDKHVEETKLFEDMAALLTQQEQLLQQLVNREDLAIPDDLRDSIREVQTHAASIAERLSRQGQAPVATSLASTPR